MLFMWNENFTGHSVLLFSESDKLTNWGKKTRQSLGPVKTKAMSTWALRMSLGVRLPENSTTHHVFLLASRGLSSFCQLLRTPPYESFCSSPSKPQPEGCRWANIYYTGYKIIGKRIWETEGDLCSCHRQTELGVIRYTWWLSSMIPLVQIHVSCELNNILWTLLTS